MEGKQALLSEENLQKIHEMSETIATQLVDDTPPDPMQPKDFVKNKLQIDTENQIKRFFEQLAFGAQELMRSILHLKETEPELYTEQLEAQMEQLGEGLVAVADNPDETRSPRQLCAISDETMHVFNRAAEELYVHQEYDKSAAVYSFLAFIEPNETGYWIGCGNSDYFVKNYDRALESYESAIELAPKVPDFYFYCAHCYKELGQVSKSLELIDQALQIIDQDLALKERREQAEQLKQYFSENKGGPV
ncbi:MAG: tetratricopeptide repeat protein [Parachlamydia sp.]|nr:tetratricopeptide repeat protein [Parachlamydia sp.]